MLLGPESRNCSPMCAKLKCMLCCVIASTNAGRTPVGTGSRTVERGLYAD
jgi:hypothetical protein